METLNGPAMSREQISKYLERIGLSSAEEPSPEFLKKLHRAHISHIPFENLDIMNGIELSMDRERLFEKIVDRHRGGVCSELNTLYNWLLESLGFDAVSYISRFVAKTAPFQQNSHRIIKTCGYITDVGVNYDHHRIPLLLQEGLVQSDGECAYRFEQDPDLGWVLWQQTAEGWRKKISFMESPQYDLDFISPTFFAEHHPASRVNKYLKVSIHRDGRFLAIREGAFLTEEKGVVREIEGSLTEARTAQLLDEVFGLRVSV